MSRLMIVNNVNVPVPNGWENVDKWYAESSLERKLPSQWANESTLSQKAVNHKGESWFDMKGNDKKYRLVACHERLYSLGQRVGRVFLGILFVLVSGGMALIFMAIYKGRGSLEDYFTGRVAERRYYGIQMIKDISKHLSKDSTVEALDDFVQKNRERLSLESFANSGLLKFINYGLNKNKHKGISAGRASFAESPFNAAYDSNLENDLNPTLGIQIERAILPHRCLKRSFIRLLDARV